MPKAEQKKNKLLTIEVLVDESLDRTAEQRENFLKGYITSIPGCKVVSTEIEDCEVIDIGANSISNE